MHDRRCEEKQVAGNQLVSTKQDNKNTSPRSSGASLHTITPLLPVSLLLLPGLVGIEIPIRRALWILRSLIRRLVLLTLLTLWSSSSSRAKPVGTIKCSLGRLCTCPSLRCLTYAGLTDAHPPNTSPNVLHGGITCIRLVRSFWRSTCNALTNRRTRRRSGALSKTHKALYGLCTTIQLLLVLSILTRRQVCGVLCMAMLMLMLLRVVLIPRLIIPSRGVLLAVHTLAVGV